MLHDMYLAVVKSPSESKQPWDSLSIIQKFQAVRPSCRSIKAIARWSRNNRASLMFSVLRELDREQRSAVVASFLGWTLMRSIFFC